MTGGELCKITLWMKYGDHPDVVKLPKGWTRYGEPCFFCGIKLTDKTHGSHPSYSGRLVCPNTWLINFKDGSGLFMPERSKTDFPFLWRDFQDKINAKISEHIGQRKIDGETCPSCGVEVPPAPLQETSRSDYRLTNQTCETCETRWSEYFKLVGYSIHAK